MNKLIYIFITLLLFAHKGLSNDTLSLDDFLKVIQVNHPLIKKANLFDEFTDAYQLKGKGTLDPKVNSNYEKKSFDNKDYFTIWQSEVKIPTRLPIDFSLGYENNQGQFLNSENSVPNNGLVYGTINLNLLRGLLFDDQRYHIQLAELNGAKSQIEKNLLTREIIYQAVTSYIKWAASFHKLQIYEDYFNLISERHQNVIDLFLNGDKPAIDTLESRINLNSAEKYSLGASAKLVETQQKINLFIWNDKGEPLQITNAVTPSSLESLISYLEDISFFNDPNFTKDPSIRKFKNEIESLELANQLEREWLKPQLNLKYNTIINLGINEFDPSLSLNDYKYGVSFEYPIMNRKTRGEIQLNEALINQNLFNQTLYEESLSNKYEGLISRQAIQENIMGIVKETISNSNALYQAETLKFQLGESSVFLLNQRERKLLEARTEQIKVYYDIGNLLNERYYLKLGQI